MPTSMLTIVRCDECEQGCQRKDMSPFNAICADCFAISYALCVDCGALLRMRPGTQRSGSRDAVYLNDPSHLSPLCFQCYQVASFCEPRWAPTPFNMSFVTYQRIRSRRKFAVEVETASCRRFSALQGQTSFGCKTDCSVSGMEFVSPVLYGDEGLVEIENFLAYGRNNDWYADEDCGCHTHYDIRDDSDEELYRIAYAYAKTYRFWSECVDYDRRANSYCHEPSYNTDGVRSFSDCGHSFRSFVDQRDRYDYLNLTAYFRHNTFENRLLEGTCDAEIICNWITIQARFMDFVRLLSFDEIDHFLAGNTQHVLSALTTIIDETDLSDWLAGRIARFN